MTNLAPQDGQSFMRKLRKDVDSLLRRTPPPPGTVTSLPWADITGKPVALDSDPGADRIIFWDDSASALAFLGLGAPLSLSGTTLDVDSASTSAEGVVELATDAETQTGTDTVRAVTPAGLQSKTASDTAIGLVELATSAETQTGSDATRAVTPAGLQSKTASTTAIGLVELATDAEAVTGTDTVRATTPSGVAAAIAAVGGGTPAGNVDFTARRSAPSGWLLCDGSAVSRTTYAALFAAINETIGTFTANTNDTLSLTNHGLYTGDHVYVTNSGGALPTGLSANTDYWVIRLTSGTFYLATSYANAVAGTRIDITAVGSGTHTIISTYGVGNGSTTFNVPNIAGRMVVARDTGQTEFDAMGETGGTKTETLTSAQIPAHQHGMTPSGQAVRNGSGTGANVTTGGGGYALQASGELSSANTGGGGSHNNLPPFIVLNAIIKT